MPLVIAVAFVFVASVAAFRVWLGHPWGASIRGGVRWSIAVCATILVLSVAASVTSDPAARQDILDRGPVISAAGVLVATVALVRMRRGAPWDDAIRSGLRWLYAVVVLYAVATWLLNDPLIGFVLIAVVTAGFWVRGRTLAPGPPRAR